MLGDIKKRKYIQGICLAGIEGDMNMVSIIMPTYNRGYIIGRAIESVCNQSYNDWELIIVDDASSDDTEKVLASYNDSRICYLKNAENKGANESRNIGASYAKGEVLAFLDSDNYWPANRLQKQLEIWKNHKEEKCFLYGKVQITDQNSVWVVPQNRMELDKLKRLELCYNVIDTNSIMISKVLFQKIKGFDKKLPRLQDWELALKLLYKYKYKAYFCDEILSFNEIQENSIGRNRKKYIEAYGVILERYVCKYSDSDKELISSIVSFCEMYKGVKLDLEKVLKRVVSKHPDVVIKMCSRITDCEQVIQKSYSMESLLYTWKIKNMKSETGTIFSKYFNENSNIKKIAIYGAGKVGLLFLEEIKRLPVSVSYGIDQVAKSTNELRIFHPDDELELVDCTIVTIAFGSEEIKECLEQKGIKNVVTIGELISKY